MGAGGGADAHRLTSGFPHVAAPGAGRARKREVERGRASGEEVENEGKGRVEE